MQTTPWFGFLRAIVYVLLTNGIFYAYYRIATFHLRLSAGPFVVGCVILALVVVAVFRKLRKQDTARSEDPLNKNKLG